MTPLVALFYITAINWQHPAGLVTADTLTEVRHKIETQPWARDRFVSEKRANAKWVDATYDELDRVFPKVCGNVYHNYTCPTDRVRLTFDPFSPDSYSCPICGETFSAGDQSGVYPEGDRYYGTMYDGWICLFFLESSTVAVELAVIGEIDDDPKYTLRAIDMLMLYANTLDGLTVSSDPDPQMRKLLTYHREGDNKILYDLACAYEVVRNHMTPEQRQRIESAVLQRMLDDIMLEPIYTYDHNNVYQWHRTIVQTALALEREELIDWSFGFGEFDAEHQPEHRSMNRLLATHFKPDGAFWEMCSGYHLYPLSHLCEFAVVSHNLSAMDPERFPAAQYDLIDPESEGGAVIRSALHWFMSMAMPNRKMPTIGDSMKAIAGMDDYYVTAEVGYRFYGLQAVGDYPAFRDGNRNWVALLYGADNIEAHRSEDTSSYLSSGWVSLRSAWNGAQTWVGLNALIPGGGHQHADRLGLLWYSHDALLTLEKATPYNELTTRVLGTLSPMHNTVTVDMVSQPQGEVLTENQIPEVALFYAGDWLQFAELHADDLYAQTSEFRRSVAVFEDVAVDLFRVSGGEIHDWTAQLAGAAPEMNVPMKPGQFEPKDWLFNGTEHVLAATLVDTWEARWRMADVNARLTMAGAPDTELFGLETYPVENAVITPDSPPCQTLCVRRRDDTPFLAVWDAWKESPNVEDLVFAGPDAARIRTGAHTYHLRFGPGRTDFDDDFELETDGAFTIVRDTDAMVIAAGSSATLMAPTGTLQVMADKPITIAVAKRPDGVHIQALPLVQFDTYQGENHPRPAPDTPVRIEGNLWK
jgi:hypothetical protein